MMNSIRFLVGIALLMMATGYLSAQSEQTVVTALERANEYEILRLNDGEKWSIDAEMINYIREGEAIFVKFIKSGSRDFKGLANKLSEANSNLILSCSMTGEAHNQLHLWLNPHLDLSRKLQDADEVNTALLIIRQIEHSFEVFNTYFKG
ncbi:MAG: hypothetical protein EA409_07600 [Saprospirales bacterium]|nr:MAG: hypothetical protein EA409_07600 [Saprospirales bacterium]